MPVKLRQRGRQVVLDGKDAMLWWQELSKRDETTNKVMYAIQIQAANGKETDFKPIITLTLAPIEHPQPGPDLVLENLANKIREEKKQE